MNTTDINNLRAQVKILDEEASKAGANLAAITEQFNTSGWTPEAIKVARKARHALSAAKAKFTTADKALWFAERAAK